MKTNNNKKEITPFDDSYFCESGLKDTSLLLEDDE